MDQQFQFNLVQIIVILVLTLIAGWACAGLYFNDKLKQADKAVDYVDDMRLEAEWKRATAELNEAAIIKTIAVLPANSRYWTTDDRIKYRQFAELCKKRNAELMPVTVDNTRTVR